MDSYEHTLFIITVVTTYLSQPFKNVPVTLMRIAKALIRLRRTQSDQGLRYSLPETLDIVEHIAIYHTPLSDYAA